MGQDEIIKCNNEGKNAMGTWGVNLYQDDVSLDVRDEYINFLKVGMNNREATKMLIENYVDIMDEEEIPLFWFALADTQWKYGRLLAEVKEKAISYIDAGTDLKHWEEDERQYKRRQKVLKELKDKLNSKQPQEKKVTKLTTQKANWEIGDILLYQILNEELKTHKWYKKYVLLNVVGKTRTNIGSLPQDIYYDEQNRISLYNWIGSNAPETKKIEKLKFVTLQNYQDALFGNQREMSGVINFTKRELKKLNIKIITKEQDKKAKNNYEDAIGTWYNIYNFDYTIVKALENAEKDNELINEC